MMRHPEQARNRAIRSGWAVWATVLVAGVCFAIQHALADTDMVTTRYVLALLIVGGAALVVSWTMRTTTKGPSGMDPDPLHLMLSGLAGLSVWPVAWWLMDLTNAALEDGAGRLPSPQMAINLPDHVLWIALQPAVYELGILFAVVLLPMVQARLLWRLALPELVKMLGRPRGAWVAGALAGVFWALSSPQNIAPALPWGLSSLGGYLLIGWVAAWSVTLVQSAWAGFAVQFVFAYASLAWTDDLFREMGRRSHEDLTWLTIVVLGIFVAVVLLQVIRYRTPLPTASPQRPRSRRAGALLPLALVVALLMIMAALDVNSRRDLLAEDTLSGLQSAQE